MGFLGKIALGIGQFLFKFFVNEKNIKKVLVFVVGLAEKYAKSTKNTIDDKAIVELKKALSI